MTFIIRSSTSTLYFCVNETNVFTNSRQPSGQSMDLGPDDDINQSTPMIDNASLSDLNALSSESMRTRIASYVKEEGEEDGEEAEFPPQEEEEGDLEGQDEEGQQGRPIQPKQALPIPPQTPVISQDQAKARMVIDQVHQLHNSQEQQIEQMRQIQQQLILNPQKEGIRQLQEQQWKLNQQIELELKEVQTLHRSVILDPPALHQLRMLLQRLKIQQQKIELFRQELQLVLNPRSPPPW